MIIDREHNTMSPDCWCNPKIEVMENGNKVIQHNDVTPEQARVISDIELAKVTSSATCVFMRKIRKIRKMSILDVAEKSGINRNTISEIESGNSINSASVTTLSRIAHAIGCDLRIELIPFEKITKE
jgi:DNA-binding XRE family transcriptional regulator